MVCSHESQCRPTRRLSHALCATHTVGHTVQLCLVSKKSLRNNIYFGCFPVASLDRHTPCMSVPMARSSSGSTLVPLDSKGLTVSGFLRLRAREVRQRSLAPFSLPPLLPCQGSCFQVCIQRPAADRTLAGASLHVDAGLRSLLQPHTAQVAEVRCKLCGSRWAWAHHDGMQRLRSAATCEDFIAELEAIVVRFRD